MLESIERSRGQAPKHSAGLLMATTIFGLLYLWFVIVSFIPAPKGNWISSTVPFDPFDREQIFVKLLFLFFLVGYVAAWKSELIAGTLFILWYAGMWGVSVLIFAPIKPGDSAGGIAMGFPVFVLGVLFVVRWFRGRSLQKV